jgi:adhesin/invasin
MWKFTLICLLAFLSIGVLGAQTYPLGEATVGVPFSLNFGYGLSELASSLSSDGLQISYSFAASGGSLPPGLTMSASGLLSGTPTTPGNFTFTITFTFNISGDGESVGDSTPFTLSLDVVGNGGPAVTANPGALSFTLTEGSASVPTQSVVIANTGTAAQTFTATATTNSGGNWLSVSPGAGAVAPFTSSSVSVNVDPGKLGAGTYLGTVSISISPADQQMDIAVIVTVSASGPQLQISQSGLFAQTVAGGANPPSQSITVLNGGSGSLNFSVSTSTTSGGQWLSASPASGTATASASSSVTINIQSAALAQGDYYGEVQFSAAGVTNSPQTASVVLHVAAASADLGAFLSTTGLIFVGQADGTAPAAQTVSVTNPSPTSLTFSTVPFFNQGTNWFTVTPASGTVSSTSGAQLSVQPTVAGLAVGVYSGEISLFLSDGTSQNIAVLLIVIPGAASKTKPFASTSAACTPTELLPVFTQLGANFSTVAAWPTPIQVTVVDDCGNFMTAGNVTASFSDNDPSLPLTSLNNGIWSATWQPSSAGAQVTITVDALELVPPLQGTQSIGGALQANPTTPSVNAGGIVSAAKSSGNQPLAPGAFTSIYGLNLGAGQNPALSLPLATHLGATQVVLGGRALPLQYAADGQVNAVIPYDVPPNTTQQLIISNGPALSVPQPVVIAPAQPAVFASADGSGSVQDFKPGSKVGVPVDTDHPISAGDVIVIYCAGLGAVTPAVAAGAAAPSSPPAMTMNPATVMIGGKSAQVSFSGLSPGYAGLYQVNALVPKGITPGDAVPLIITVAGFDSAPVTVAVK